MTGGSETNPDGAPIRPPAPAERTWTHPSEVGLATRGSSDRRRSSIIATGVVLGGLGLLLSGVLLGSDEQGTTVSARSAPIDRIERSVATVMIVQGGETSVATGLVLDSDGHLVVPMGGDRELDRVWVRGSDGGSVRATLVATDDEGDLSVLRLAEPAGSPPQLADRTPSAGLPVLLVRATVDRTVTRAGTIGSEVLVGELPPAPWTHHVLVTTAAGHPATAVEAEGRSAPDQFVFDRAGHLLGLAEAGHGDAGRHDQPLLRGGRELLLAAERLLDDRG